MLEIAGGIEIATSHPALVISLSISRQVAPAGTSLSLYVGPFMRFVALDSPRHGGELQVYGFDNTWHVHSTFEET